MLYNNKLCSLQHIILIGFKNVGKSTIAQHLSGFLDMEYIDLDKKFENYYLQKYQQRLSCRDIMHEYGELFYRRLESIVLQELLSYSPHIIALGGGTIVTGENYAMLCKHCLIHIVADKNATYARVKNDGALSIIQHFDKLWDERYKIYQNVSDITIENNATIDIAVIKIIQALQQNRYLKK